MSDDNKPRVLAIGIDAAEPALVRSLIDQGRLPVLKGLLERGRWSRVEAPAQIGSGAVWPTFVTGAEPAAHGIYSEWVWQPESMSVSRCSSRGLAPFWRGLEGQDLTIGVLDVPFAPLVGLTRGFEISEWGAHDKLEGHTEVAPAAAQALVTTAHPLATERLDVPGPDHLAELKHVSAACVRGAELRGDLVRRLIQAGQPDLCLVVFPEVHHLAHFAWHTVAPQHPFYSDERFHRAAPPGAPLADLFSAIDRQIGRIIAAAAPETALLVFSLHGMQPTRGIPRLLDPLLFELGLARPATWKSQSWAGRASALLKAVKQNTPAPLKALYRRRASAALASRLAQPTMLTAYDWSKTLAIALPTDQHGWIRVNLAGREARGIVPPQQYDRFCAELQTRLSSLTTADGRPLVRDILRPAGNSTGTSLRLPDLIVHWTDAAFDFPLRLRDSAVTAYPIGLKFTGQHAPQGFCIASGTFGATTAGDVIKATELSRLLTAPFGQG